MGLRVSRLEGDLISLASDQDHHALPPLGTSRSIFMVVVVVVVLLEHLRYC